MKIPKFYNSLTKRLEPLDPKEPGKVRIYNCGPTVYKRQHLGNLRRYLFSDFLRRTLEFLGYEVREITNITDVGHLTQDDIDAGEDKLEMEAKKQKTTPRYIAEQQIKLFEQDLKALNIGLAHKYPRASAHIKQMQDIIATLIEKGHAYRTPSGVYFDTTTFKDYGKLSGNTLDAIEVGARIEVREDKKHPADFALWKTDDPKHLQQWDSPWGHGYPGWHIECSAMALEYLGPDIDIHTGGEDNRFPHHENEIAQSEAATGEPFVRTWMHNRHLLFSGEKLAKREGEQLTLDTLKERGYSALAFRLLVFGSHYRSPMDFSWEAMHQAQENLKAIEQLLRRIHEGTPRVASLEEAEAGETEPVERVKERFSTALMDDLNTPTALAVVMDFLRDANKTLDESGDTASLLPTLHELDRVLGIIGPLEVHIASETIPAKIQELADAREQARSKKQFEKADELRQEIEMRGYVLEDTSSGPRLRKNN